MNQPAKANPLSRPAPSTASESVNEKCFQISARLLELGRDLATALLLAWRGGGPLFMASKPTAEGIYMLTSADSICVLAIRGYEFIGEFITGTPPGRPNNFGYDTCEGVHNLLAAMGVGWRAISSNDIATGLSIGNLMIRGRAGNGGRSRI